MGDRVTVSRRPSGVCRLVPRILFPTLATGASAGVRRSIWRATVRCSTSGPISASNRWIVLCEGGLKRPLRGLRRHRKRRKTFCFSARACCAVTQIAGTVRMERLRPCARRKPPISARVPTGTARRARRNGHFPSGSASPTVPAGHPGFAAAAAPGGAGGRLASPSAPVAGSVPAVPAHKAVAPARRDPVGGKAAVSVEPPRIDEGLRQPWSLSELLFPVVAQAAQVAPKCRGTQVRDLAPAGRRQRARVVCD